jgi:AcrR family transcriptional regulator
VTRKRNAATTRVDILVAARARFAAEGYDRATMRAIASDVGVDAALVNRYFGTKQALFAEAVEFKLHFPDLAEVAPERLADVLLPYFFEVWEEDGTFLALLRAAMASEEAAAKMRQVFARQVAPALGVVAPDLPKERAALLGAFIIGLATTRYVLRTPPIANIDRDGLIAWSRPLFALLLAGKHI